MQADDETGAAFTANMQERGIYNLPGGRWYVGATHGERELERVRVAIEASMAALRPISAPTEN